jgi:hypothetical protein
MKVCLYALYTSSLYGAQAQHQLLDKEPVYFSHALVLTFAQKISVDVS